MPKVRASSGTIGTTSLPISSSRSIFASMRTNTIVVETVRPSVPLANSSNRSPNSHLSGAALDLPRRQVAAERLAALAHVGDLGAVSAGR